MLSTDRSTLMRPDVRFNLIDWSKFDEATPVAEKPACTGENSPAAQAQQIGIIKDIQHLLLDLPLLFRIAIAASSGSPPIASCKSL